MVPADVVHDAWRLLPFRPDEESPFRCDKNRNTARNSMIRSLVAIECAELISRSHKVNYVAMLVAWEYLVNSIVVTGEVLPQTSPDAEKHVSCEREESTNDSSWLLYRLRPLHLTSMMNCQSHSFSCTAHRAFSITVFRIADFGCKFCFLKSFSGCFAIAELPVPFDQNVMRAEIKFLSAITLFPV